MDFNYCYFFNRSISKYGLRWRMVRNDINYMNSEIGRAELSAQFKLKQIHDITNSLLDNKNSNNKPMKSDFTIGYMVAIINVIDYLSNNEDKHMD